MADELAPTAVQILDPMHAIEHASNCAKILFVDNDNTVKLWVERVKFILYQDRPSALLLELRACRIGATNSQQSHRYRLKLMASRESINKNFTCHQTSSMERLR